MGGSPLLPGFEGYLSHQGVEAGKDGDSAICNAIGNTASQCRTFQKLEKESTKGVPARKSNKERLHVLAGLL